MHIHIHIHIFYFKPMYIYKSMIHYSQQQRAVGFQSLEAGVDIAFFLFRSCMRSPTLSPSLSPTSHCVSHCVSYLVLSHCVSQSLPSGTLDLVSHSVSHCAFQCVSHLSPTRNLCATVSSTVSILCRTVSPAWNLGTFSAALPPPVPNIIKSCWVSISRSWGWCRVPPSFGNL